MIRAQMPCPIFEQKRQYKVLYFKLWFGERVALKQRQDQAGLFAHTLAHDEPHELNAPFLFRSVLLVASSLMSMALQAWRTKRCE